MLPGFTGVWVFIAISLVVLAARWWYGRRIFAASGGKVPLWVDSAIAAGLLGVFALVLYGMGRIPICKCGYVKLWHGITFSSENSQHITDWYAFSHVIHGFGFYLLFWLLGRRWNWSVGLRLLLAIMLEATWEVFENTDFVINRYRAVTISLDYYGDSVLNSTFDVIASIVGFVLAYRLPVWVIIALTLAMEIFVGYYIRDNLLLNIIMLLYPSEAILRWQQGGP